MLARLDGFDAKSGRTRRKRYERRDDETRRCAAGRRFLFVAPFSVAHPCRQENGIRLLFFLSPRLASCPLSRARIIRSYRIVSVPWKRCGEGVVALGDTPRRVGGAIWLLVPPSRPLVSLCGPFDFPVSACGQDTCAVFVSSFSCVIRWPLAAGRIVFSFVSSLVSLARLVGASRAILCGSLLVLSCSSIQFVSVSLGVSLGVSLCGPSPSSRAIRLARASR